MVCRLTMPREIGAGCQSYKFMKISNQVRPIRIPVPPQSRVTNALIERYAELSRAPGYRETPDRTFVRTFVRTASYYDSGLQATPEKLAPITTPMVILCGERDELIPASDAERFRRAIPNSKVIVYANTGHVPLKEAAERTALNVDTWMGGDRQVTTGIPLTLRAAPYGCAFSFTHFTQEATSHKSSTQ